MARGNGVWWGACGQVARLDRLCASLLSFVCVGPMARIIVHVMSSFLSKCRGHMLCDRGLSAVRVSIRSARTRAMAQHIYVK